MKRFKKGIALLLGASVAISSMTGVTADAMFQWDTAVEVPDGYEEFEASSGMITYNKTTDSFAVIVYEMFRYNFVELVLNENVDGDAVYEQYCEKIGFDKAEVEGLHIKLYDKVDAGEDPRTPESIEDRSEAVKSMCSELKEAGLIAQASYTTFWTTYRYGRYEKKLYVTNYSGTEEDLTQIVSEYTDDAVISEGFADGEGDYYVSVPNCETVDDVIAINSAIVSSDPVCNSGIMCIFQDGEMIDGTDAVDILAAFEETGTTGDVNADGTTDITDAVLILQHYAESAASGVSTASETNMDVNGDGSIDLDDASAVLQIYAENAAGVDAS